jgi:hypothetical protein
VIERARQFDQTGQPQIGPAIFDLGNVALRDANPSAEVALAQAGNLAGISERLKNLVGCIGHDIFSHIKIVSIYANIYQTARQSQETIYKYISRIEIDLLLQIDPVGSALGGQRQGLQSYRQILLSNKLRQIAVSARNYATQRPWVLGRSAITHAASSATLEVKNAQPQTAACRIIDKRQATGGRLLPPSIDGSLKGPYYQAQADSQDYDPATNYRDSWLIQSYWPTDAVAGETCLSVP